MQFFVTIVDFLLCMRLASLQGCRDLLGLLNHKLTLCLALNSYPVFSAKCFRLQDVVLPDRRHVGFVAHKQNWNFALNGKITLKQKNNAETKKTFVLLL